MGQFAAWSRGNWPLMAFALYWIIHTYMWGIWGWRETKAIFDAAWWFDFMGHTVAGIMGASNDLYLFWRRGDLRRLGKFHLTKDIVWDVGIFGIVWEGLEFLWDVYVQPNFAPHLAKAQNGPADIVIDLFTNPFFALLTLLAFFAASSAINRWILKKADQEESLAAEVIYIAEEIEGLEDKLDEKIQLLSETKRELVIRHLRERWVRRKERVKIFFRKKRKRNTPPF